MKKKVEEIKKNLQNIENVNNTYPIFFDKTSEIFIGSSSNIISENESEFQYKLKKKDYQNLKESYIYQTLTDKEFKEILNLKSIKKSYKFIKNKYAVDILLQYEDKIILIDRLFSPYGYAMPGGFIDKNETEKNAALRELQEETSLIIDKSRIKKISEKIDVSKTDPRCQKNIKVYTTPFYIYLKEEELSSIVANDDAKDYKLVSLKSILSKSKKLAFKHHYKIIKKYFKEKSIEYKNIN